jgi:phosphatidylinositol 3,5-bisphosphate 5-phosphatase
VDDSAVRCQWPARLQLTVRRFRLIPPHVYLAVVVFSWGIIASLQAATTSYGALLLLRITLGLAEAAFCGVPFYLSFFFRREELAFRTGLFISAAPLATSCASSLAWLITALAPPTGGIAPWRLLFLVEGFPSVLVAWYCYRHVADSPGSAWFLTKRERMLAVHRLRGNVSKAAAEEERENQRDGKAGRHSIKMSEIVETVKDPKSYLTAVRISFDDEQSLTLQAMYFSCNVAFSSMPVFLPTIIQE